MILMKIAKKNSNILALLNLKQNPMIPKHNSYKRFINDINIKDNLYSHQYLSSQMRSSRITQGKTE